MSKKNLIASVALALVVAGTVASLAEARKCPRGTENVNDVCVPVNHQ